MARQVYIWNQQKRCLERIEEFVPENKSAAVIDDSMPLTKNHIDGKWYDSKSEFRRAAKARGFIEAGNEKPMPSVRKEYLSDRKIESALRKAKSLYGMI